LLKLGKVSSDEAVAIAEESRRVLEAALKLARETKTPDAENDSPGGCLLDHQNDTAITRKKLSECLEKLACIPEKFNAHTKVAAIMRRRRSAATGQKKIDWATGEALAYATLLDEGVSIRLSGQDSERGTFGHRHAVLHDARTGERHVPLSRCAVSDNCSFSVHNSPLTETAVLAFEFGYSIEADRELVVWEAQFGDFTNVAQVVIDQFLSSSEAKWRQPSGLVLFLPHGLEGQGPEHSSARPERFLQLCAGENIEVTYLSTASQVFHRLRQQIRDPQRRPLIVFTPKRMLQNPAASSSMEEFCNGEFLPVIPDRGGDEMDRVLLCAGQFAADLASERNRRGAKCAIIRLERFYPFPAEALTEVICSYPDGVPVTWVQEEPENMGAWRWLRPQLEELLGRHPVEYVARPERASPATGSLVLHQREQAMIFNRVFGGEGA
jgi:2-oxoglutarate dehydrogenase E1 component